VGRNHVNFNFSKKSVDKHQPTVLVSYVSQENAMLLQIDFKSGKPVYLQLVDQIRYIAASGGLRPGEPLPSIRPLAEELRVNRNTIAKAYAELESQGVIETIPGKGCFLKENNSPIHQAGSPKTFAQGNRRGRGDRAPLASGSRLVPGDRQGTARLL